MAIPTSTYRIITQGKARVRAIEVLGTIQPTGPFERVGPPADGRLQAPTAWYREARTRVGQRGDIERVGAYWG